MAVVLVFRALIALSPSAYRVVKIEQSASGQPGADSIPRALWDRLRSDESDESLTLAVSGAVGKLASVATYSETFELRKLQVLFGRTSGAATPEDDAVITYHFLKLVGGTPSSEWVEGDFTALESAYDTAWNAVKPRFLPSLTLRQYRWYATGPQIDAALGGPGRTGPPRRVVDRNLPGTSGATVGSIPQAAISVTEKTSDPKSWGRFFLPGPFAPAFLMNTAGRLLSAEQTTIGNAFDAFYEAALTNGTPVVVYSAAKAARATAGGGSLPAALARALTVDELQVDDIVDVIRSRRWNAPLLRLQRQVGA